jgi:acyl-coenzyme A thioesterase PaaI-like protein
MNHGYWIKKAETSSLYLHLLNFNLNRMVPFNKPHGIRIAEIRDGYIKVKLPWKKANFNHIKGIHACALATLAEFTTGFLLLTKLDVAKYRLIMQRITIDYHYQAKMDVEAKFDISDEWLEKMIINPLKGNEKAIVECEVKIHDLEGNQVCTGFVTWQIKSWERVKTKV